MKKIIVGILSLAVAFTASNAFAAGVSWNTASNDCRGISIINATTDQGYVNPCWPLSTVSADAGDVINVRMYYHNTGTQTANNVHIMVNTPLSSTSTTKSFTGRITSDSASTSIGPVTANISSSQTLTFMSAKWYTNNTAETLTPLLGGQSGAEVLTDGGLDIGSVAPGWATQGSVVVAFRVSSNTVVQTCQDHNASNYGGALPCTYPAQVCQDHNASNYGGALPCQYPAQVCQDHNASNYGGALPCRYPTALCQDTNALNYHGALPCRYPPALCQDVNASNYHGALPCVYPQNICRDINAVNYGSVGTCIYPQPNICRDPSATNYNQPGSCVYYVPPVNNCTISSFNANGSQNVTVTSGSPVTLNWSTYGCSSVSITNLNGGLPTTGSQLVYPTYSTNYILTAYGGYGGSQTQTVYVNVSQIQPVYNACAVTSIATNISRDSAQLNGLVSGGNGSNSTYFEYGPTVSLGSVTPTRYVGNGAVTEFVSGLSSNSAYYFRLVSNCNGAISQGSIQSFYTLGAPVTTGRTTTTTTVVRQPTIVTGTTIIGTSSPIMLSIENRYESIGVGDTMDYIVRYRNIGSTVLTHPILQVVAPKGIVFTNASRGTYSAETNTLTVQLEDLYPGAPEGTVFIQGRVDSVPVNNVQIVTTAVLVYTNPSGAQENAIAYVLNKPKDFATANNLGAAAFFLGIFPGTLLGWLILIIIILLIILLARRYYAQPVIVSHMNVPPPPAH